MAQSGSLESSHSDAIRVETETPSLSAARLEGRWRVLYTVTDSNLSNFQPGKPLKFFWELDPRCEDGACSADLFIPLARNPGANGSLIRDGAEYDGGIRKASLGFCGDEDNPPNDSAVISVRLTRARGSQGEWVATRFRGKFREYFPPRLGCSAGFLEANIKGLSVASD